MTTPGQRRIQSQAGFSMIEMLMTALILAIGLLGLAMFQTMALRSTRGNRNVNTAVLLANQILDQAEEEGRLTWLNLTNTQLTGTSNANFTNLKYLAIGNGGAPLAESFNSQGGAVDATSADLSVNTPFFHTLTAEAAAPSAVTGSTSLFTVVVNFTDLQYSTNGAQTRTVTLSRSITHG